MGLQLKLTTNNFNKKFLKNYPALRIGGTCVFHSGGERRGECNNKRCCAQGAEVLKKS